MNLSEDVGYLYFVLEYTGVALAAVVGGTVAKRMHFDIVGFAFIALFSSLSGGLIRDALLADGPAMALQNPGYLITATIGALVAYFVNFHGKLWDNFRFYADVTTIGVWAVGGTLRALENELAWPACILLAVITAISGTMVRDLVLRKVPGLFTSQKMYVFPAIVASVVMLVMNNFNLISQGMLAAAFTAPVLAIAVYWQGRQHPQLDHAQQERPLEMKLGEAMDIGTKPDEEDAGEVVAELEERLHRMGHNEVVDTLRALIVNELHERTRAKS